MAHWFNVIVIEGCKKHSQKLIRMQNQVETVINCFKEKKLELMSYHKQEICFSQPSGIPGLQIAIQRTNLSKISKPNSRSTLLNISKQIDVI